MKRQSTKNGFTRTPFVALISKRQNAQSATGRKVWGFTLTELVIFVGMLAIIVLLVIKSLLVMTSTFTEIRLSKNVNNASLVALERIVREIRLAQSVDSAGSIFDSSPGYLSLNTKSASGTPVTLDFFISGNNLVIQEGVSSPINLTNNIIIDTLIFRKIDVSTTTAIKIELEMTAQRGDKTRSAKYYSTVVLRNLY